MRRKAVTADLPTLRNNTGERRSANANDQETPGLLRRWLGRAFALIAIAALRALMTTPKNLGVVDGRLAACPNSPNCVSTQATDKHHKIEPIAFDGSPDDAMRRLQSAIAAIPRMKIITRTEDYLHAEATTLILRFKDDVEIFVDRQAKVIHFRSASRVGHSDLGANRARMERIRKIFEQP